MSKYDLPLSLVLALPRPIDVKFLDSLFHKPGPLEDSVFCFILITRKLCLSYENSKDNKIIGANIYGKIKGYSMYTFVDLFTRRQTVK